MQTIFDHVTATMYTEEKTESYSIQTEQHHLVRMGIIISSYCYTDTYVCYTNIDSAITFPYCYWSYSHNWLQKKAIGGGGA